MKILFDEIPEEGSLAVECFAGRKELDMLVGETGEGIFRYDTPVKGVFSVSRKARTVFLEYEIKGSLGAVCSRCLADFLCPLRGDGRLVLFPEGECGAEGPDEEGDKEFYDGKVVDLGIILAEEVALMAPLAPLCSEGCKGLCHLCGSNLNKGECGCMRTPEDERFSILKNIKF